MVVKQHNLYSLKVRGTCYKLIENKHLYTIYTLKDEKNRIMEDRLL